MSCDTKINERCSYCGSISPLEAIQLMKTPGTSFSGADWKWGWPHKFYFGTRKFYNNHLTELTDEQLTEFSNLSKEVFGIKFTKDEKGIKYSAPADGGFYGWQLWGVIGKDGKPDHSQMNPKQTD